MSLRIKTRNLDAGGKMAEEKESILIIDDEKSVRKLLLSKLSSEGYECQEAGNDEQALHELENKAIDLVILDIIMPEMDGHEALKEIRKVESNAGIPVGMGSKVIMTTALEDHKSIREAFRHSADGYVVKPIEKKKLISTLQELGLELEIPL